MFLPRFMSKLLKSGLLQQILVPSTSTSNTSILTFYWFCILAKTYATMFFLEIFPLNKIFDIDNCIFLFLSGGLTF